MMSSTAKGAKKIDGEVTSAQSRAAAAAGGARRGAATSSHTSMSNRCSTGAPRRGSSTAPRRRPNYKGLLKLLFLQGKHCGGLGCKCEECCTGHRHGKKVGFCSLLSSMVAKSRKERTRCKRGSTVSIHTFTRKLFPVSSKKVIRGWYYLIFLSPAMPVRKQKKIF